MPTKRRGEAPVVTTDWTGWHGAYDDPNTALSRRLRIVQDMIRRWLARRTVDQTHALSMCAGQGRDLLPVLVDVRPFPFQATLVEWDAANVAAARDDVRRLSLLDDFAHLWVDIRRGDAGRSDTYRDIPRADLLLACGVFGNISDGDVCCTISALPQLCRAGATVIWTRSRRAPDLTPAVRSWLNHAGFEEISYEAPDDALFSVGAHRLHATSKPLAVGQTWFKFLR